MQAAHMAASRVPRSIRRAEKVDRSVLLSQEALQLEFFPAHESEDFALLQKILSKFGQRLGALEDNECQASNVRSVHHRWELMGFLTT